LLQKFESIYVFALFAFDCMQDPNAVAVTAPDPNEEQQPLPLLGPKKPEV